MAIFNSYVSLPEGIYISSYPLLIAAMPVYHSLCRKTLRIRVAYQHDCKVGSNADSSFLLSSIFGWKAFALRAT